MHKAASSTLVVALVACVVIGSTANAQLTSTTGNAEEVVGLWKAKRSFRQEAHGPLVIESNGAAFTAHMVGRAVPVRVDGGELTFEMPNGKGTFRGKLEPGGAILGHWLRPGSPVNNSRYSSPVVLTADGSNRWRGNVAPLEDEFTFYLLATKQPDGSIAAVLRNPERDYGTQLGVERITRNGNALNLIARRGGQERVVATGAYDAANQMISLAFPSRAGIYEFRRDGNDSEFYPRGKSPGRYTYQPPMTTRDGWRTGTLDEANISRTGIEKLVQRIVEMPMDAAAAMQIHAILVARHGKLVLEEYFHGEHRDKLHETRSAAKSITAIVVGAAIQAGALLTLSTPVYQAMNGGAFPAGLDSLKKAMTLEHLLTMSSGYFCDDSNNDAPGNEERMWDQEQEPDFYRYTMRVAMATPPGEKSVYCSASPNLALGVLGRATGESPEYSFDRLIAGPLKIERYAWPLDPAFNPYGGGGLQLIPRDFLKLAQLMLNGGTWEGKRILAPDFVASASARLYNLRNLKYGYLWWVEDYPYKARTIATYSARGAGGQIIMVVPELDLVLALYAGNYSSGAAMTSSLNLIPTLLLPAVLQPGDNRNAAVVERAYRSPYGRSPDGSRVKPKT